MAITYTTSGSAVFASDFEIELYGGTQPDDTNWLDGNAGGSYPGSLAGFLASNSDGNAVAGVKLVMGKFTTVLADDETLTVGGDASRILAVVVGATSVANAGVELKTISAAGVAQFTVVGAPGANVTALLIVA
jgi:hypothetical protein